MENTLKVSNKKDIVCFRAFTGLLSAQVLMAPVMYILIHEKAIETMNQMGYPEYLLYILGVVKPLGILVIWANRSSFLKYLAFAGFFYNTILAAIAHLMVGDVIGSIPTFTCMTFLVASYFFDRKLKR